MGRILTPPCTPIASRSSGDGDSDSSKRNWVSLIEAINVFFVKLRKQASRGVSSATKKIQSQSQGGLIINNNNNSDHSPKSPLAKPKQLFVNLSNKAIQLRHKGNNKKAAARRIEGEDEADPDFGDGGLWQRNILMGDKCQPLNFSGVIYYDNNGKQLPEFPMKSPRASPLPSYMYASSEKY